MQAIRGRSPACRATAARRRCLRCRRCRRGRMQSPRSPARRQTQPRAPAGTRNRARRGRCPAGDGALAARQQHAGPDCRRPVAQHVARDDSRHQRHRARLGFERIAPNPRRHAVRTRHLGGRFEWHLRRCDHHLAGPPEARIAGFRGRVLAAAGVIDRGFRLADCSWRGWPARRRSCWRPAPSGRWQ